MWIDTHAHLVDEQLVSDLDQVIADARDANVTRIISVATDFPTSQKCAAISERYIEIFASVGIHPNQCHEASESDFDAVAKLAENHPRVVAIGETGLDRYWDFAPFELQVEWFHKHIELSMKTGLPLIVHMRDCEQDILDCFSKYSAKSLNGVMHSFVGDWSLAKSFLDLGLYISFSGMVTFKKNDDLRKVAAKIPSDRILIETDSPYLSPHPHRNQRPNQPGLVIHTGQCLAETRNQNLDDFSSQTSENARRLFGGRFV